MSVLNAHRNAFPGGLRSRMHSTPCPETTTTSDQRIPPTTIHIVPLISSCPWTHPSSSPYPGTPSLCSCVAFLYTKCWSAHRVLVPSKNTPVKLERENVRCCLLAFSIFAAAPILTSR